MNLHDHPAALALLLALTLVVGQFGFFDFLGGVVAALQSLIGFIIDLLVFLFNLLINLLVFVWNVLVAVFNFFLGIVRHVAGFFRFLWDRFFKVIFTKLINGIIRLHQWLEEKLAPVLRFLQKVRAFVDRIFNTYIRPILRIISRVRQFLTVLRLFGLDIARRLDRILAQVQGNIAQAFLIIRGALNLAIDWINALGDARKLARMILLVTAGRRAVALWTQITTRLPIGFFFPTPLKEGKPAPPAHERACVLTPGFVPPTGNNLLDLLISQANLPEVLEATEWPGVDVDALEVLPYFDDSFYTFLDGLGAGQRLGDRLDTAIADWSQQRGFIWASGELARDFFRRLTA